MLIISKFTYFFTPIINMQVKFNEIMILIIAFHKHLLLEKHLKKPIFIQMNLILL